MNEEKHNKFQDTRMTDYVTSIEKWFYKQEKDLLFVRRYLRAIYLYGVDVVWSSIELVGTNRRSVGKRNEFDGDELVRRGRTDERVT